MAYEHDHGLALTGEASEALLKRILFGAAAGPEPAGTAKARSSDAEQVIRAVQKGLVALGYQAWPASTAGSARIPSRRSATSRSTGGWCRRGASPPSCWRASRRPPRHVPACAERVAAPRLGPYTAGRCASKSEIWVKAYLRRCQGEGLAAVLVRRGDADAGAIYIKVSRLDGTAGLYGPAPAGLAEAREERRWQAVPRRGIRRPRATPTPISRARSTSIPTSGSLPSRIASAGIFSRIGWRPAARAEINHPLTPVAVKCSNSP